MLVAWAALVVSSTPPSCPASQQPEWARASAFEKREMVRRCSPSLAPAPVEPLEPVAAAPSSPQPAGRAWRYRAGFMTGLGSTWSVSGLNFPYGFGAGGVTGAFFAFVPVDAFEFRMLIDDTLLLDFGGGFPFPRVALSTGPGFVAWVGAVGFGLGVLAGLVARSFVGFSVAGLASMRVRFGEQPRHEVAVEGGVTFGLGYAGGDYLPGFADGVARVTYTVSWGFAERRVALPAAAGAE